MTKLYIRLATKLGESEVRHHEREMLVFSLLGCLIQLGGTVFPTFRLSPPQLSLSVDVLRHSEECVS